MIVLFWTGDRLERLIGKWRYLIIYFGAGLCGNLLSLLVTQGKGTLTVSAGASGAILVYLGFTLGNNCQQRKGRRTEYQRNCNYDCIEPILWIYQYRSGQLVSCRRTD